jgi:hypothetical protein
MYLSNQSKDQVLSENTVEANIKCILKITIYKYIIIM